MYSLIWHSLSSWQMLSSGCEKGLRAVIKLNQYIAGNTFPNLPATPSNPKRSGLEFWSIPIEIGST